MSEIADDLRELDQAFHEDVELHTEEDAWHFSGFADSPDLEPVQAGVRTWYAIRKNARPRAEELRSECECLMGARGRVVEIDDASLSPDDYAGLAELLGLDAGPASDWVAVGFVLHAKR